MTDPEASPARPERSPGLSVFSRFRLAGAAVILGVGLVAVVFYGIITSHFFGEILSRTLGPYSDTLAEHALANPDPELWQRMAERHRVALLAEPVDGPPIAFDAKGRRVSPIPQAFGEGSIQAVRTGNDGSRITFFWSILVARTSHLPLMGGLVLMVLVVVGSAFWFLQRQLRPLVGLHRGVEAVARGDFETEVAVVRNDEIGQVAKAFNAMAGQVGQMIDDRERLLADVSHELRSPITRMKVALELMPEDDKRDVLARDLKEMENLIAVLLEREALRSKTGSLERESFDLRLLASEVASTFADRSPGLDMAPGQAVTIDADPAMIKLLIQNLLDNALKFSHPDSHPVALELERRDDRVVLRIQDDGIGIPAGSEDRLFEPFVKLDPARGHGAGYGLGLNLCHRIVQLHGGTLRLRPVEPRGTVAIVTLMISGQE